MKDFPEIINFKITHRCNNHCPYCYDSKKNVPEIDIAEMKKIFLYLKSKGAKAIELTGGEPMLREDIAQVVNLIKKCELKAFLDTGGDFFKGNEQLFSKIDVLGLPLDFPNKSYRNPNNFSNVIQILEFYKNKKTMPSIRVGTVVTKDNLHLLKEVGEILSKYPIDLWKIYEFIPINEIAFDNKTSLQVPYKEYLRCAKEAQNLFQKKLNIIVSTEESRNKAYFFLDASGEVFVPMHERGRNANVFLGSVFDKKTLKKWAKMAHKEKYLKNVKVTFDKPAKK